MIKHARMNDRIQRIQTRNDAADKRTRFSAFHPVDRAVNPISFHRRKFPIDGKLNTIVDQLQRSSDKNSVRVHQFQIEFPGIINTSKNFLFRVHADKNAKKLLQTDSKSLKISDLGLQIAPHATNPGKNLTFPVYRMRAVFTLEA